MNIGDYVLHDGVEYTVEAKTIGGDKIKISRVAHNQGWLKKTKTISLWTDRVNVVQILTIIGDEGGMDEEETLVHNYRAEMVELIAAIEVMKHQSPQHHFLAKFGKMVEGGWNFYQAGGKWRFYNSDNKEAVDIVAPSLEELIKKVNKL